MLILLVSGGLLVGSIMMDVGWTTLTTQGSGWLTRLFTAGVGRCSRGINRVSRGRRLLTAVGPVTLVALGLFWLLGLWLGWFLLFSAWPGEIVDTQTQRPADWVERAYYVGFTLSTLGVGDFKPDGPATRLLTSLAAFNGLVLVTLIITYAIPLVQGVVDRKTLAFSIFLMGETPQEMVVRGCGSHDLHTFESALAAIGKELVHCSEQRLAYPILDFFYSDAPCFSLGLQLAKLDEALSLISLGLQPADQPGSYILGNITAAIGHYLNRVERQPDTAVPPLPSISPLLESRLSMVNEGGLKMDFNRLAERRARLHKLVRNEGWNWSLVEN